MSYKKFVATLLFASLSSTCLLSSIAKADEPELYFYPKNKWTVTRTSPEQAQLPTCSVTNELNNGYVLKMSGTTLGINAIDIDFRQNAFQKNLKYEVQYSIPGITRAIVSSKATSANLIASDISDKQEFVEGLTSAGVLDVQIRDNNFRIYLTGLKASMPQFDDCVAPAEILAQDDTIAPIPTFIKEPQPTSDALAPPPPITAAANSAPDISVAPVSDPAKLRPKPSERPRYTELLAEKLKQENKNYQPESEAAAEVQPQSAAHIPAVKPAQKPELVHTSVRTPKAKYNITRNEEPIVYDLTKSDNNNAAARVVSNVEPASGQVSVIRDDFVDMRNKISSLESELIALREKNSMLDEELKMSLQDSEQEKLSVSSDNWNLERATMKYNESERQIMRLGRQLQTQRAVCQKEKSELETMLFDPKLTNQGQLTKLSSMEADLDKTKSELYRQQRQYEERIQLLEQQLKTP